MIEFGFLMLFGEGVLGVGVKGGFSSGEVTGVDSLSFPFTSLFLSGSLTFAFLRGGETSLPLRLDSGLLRLAERTDTIYRFYNIEVHVLSSY